MNFIIGLTGGIGSGKTAASDWFESHDIDVVDADQAARWVVEPGTPALKAIADQFGSAILSKSGTLDRTQLREIVFKNPEFKKWLEQLLHPLIRQAIVNKLSESTSIYSILVSPLLFETNQHLLVHRSLLIDVPEALQIKRVMQRDQSGQDLVESIIASQMPRDSKIELADDVVDNSWSLETLYENLEKLHVVYCKLANENRT